MTEKTYRHSEHSISASRITIPCSKDVEVTAGQLVGVFIKNGRHRYLHTKNATGCLHYIQKLVEDVANQSIISKEDPNCKILIILACYKIGVDQICSPFPRSTEQIKLKIFTRNPNKVLYVMILDCFYKEFL